LDHYPLPTFDDLSQNWINGKYFSVIDLNGAYLQVQVSKASEEFLTINTHKGLFRYKRMVYGWSGAPSEFQRIIDLIIVGIPHCCAYLDDICVPGKTKKEAEDNLARLLSRLNEYGVLVNLSKCKFLQKCVSYVRHELSSKGILPSNVYLAAVRDSSPPENPSKLVKFLGILYYYLPHIPDLSTISRPLYVLSLVSQGSDELHWNQEQLKAFDLCKNAFINSKALKPFNASRPIVVATDASPVGTGAVLYNIGDQDPVFFS
jgi:hypothetical protein